MDRRAANSAERLVVTTTTNHRSDMARRISPPRLDSEEASRAAVSPHEVERRKRERQRGLATLYVRRAVGDSDALAEVMQMLGLDGEADAYLTGPVSPDAAMSGRSVR